MPADDLRLERALRDAAPVVDTAGVLDQVARKRTRRRRTHRLGAVAAVLGVVLVIGATAVLVARHDGSSPHVAVPPAGVSARVVTGNRAVDATIGRVRAPTARGARRPDRHAARTALRRDRDRVGGERRPRRQRRPALARRARRRVAGRRRLRLQGAGDLDHRGRGCALGADPQPPGHGGQPARHVPQAHRHRSAIRSPTSCRSTPTRWARSRRSAARCGCRCATASCSSTPPTVTSCGASTSRPPPAGGWRWRARVRT